jgi:DNA-binding MarR family transcriptional regulator
MAHEQDQDRGSWTLLTAHGRALVAIAQDPDARMRDLAQIVGVTERTVQAIVADLEAAGYVAHTRIGRRNRYTVHLDRPFRHPAQDGHLVGPLLDVLGASDAGND